MRIPLSRLAVAAGLFVLCSTDSYWETKDELISFVIFFLGVVLVAVASLGRMWCSLYIAGYKDEKLITNGPYSLCRNPLYFFSMVGVIGVGFSTETFIFPLIFLILFSIYYPFVIHLLSKAKKGVLKVLLGLPFQNTKKKFLLFFHVFHHLKNLPNTQ